MPHNPNNRTVVQSYLGFDYAQLSPTEAYRLLDRLVAPRPIAFWHWKLEGTGEIAAGLQLLPQEFDLWIDLLMPEGLERLRQDGKTIKLVAPKSENLAQ